MRGTVLNAVAICVAIALGFGCGDKKGADIPSKLDQPLPKVAAPAGGGGGEAAPKQAPQPTNKAD